jgi:glutamine cyclotransferase
MKKFAPLLFLVLLSCNDGEPEKEPTVPGPKTMTDSIVATYPHDTSSYTQGLLVYKGEMYEGTGNTGFSKLKKVDLATGKSLKEISLPNNYFGEGITILRDTIYQLTWKDKKAFAYTLADFKLVREFDVDFEGWGLTTDGNNLIVSNGGSDLLFFDSNFKLLKSQTVTESGSPTFNLNELEFIDGFIYANQYEYPYIFKIDPATGVVVAKADLTRMWNRIKAVDPRADVPNGIAYDADSKKIYITGKWWPELYEVQFSQ